MTKETLHYLFQGLLDKQNNLRMQLHDTQKALEEVANDIKQLEEPKPQPVSDTKKI